MTDTRPCTRCTEPTRQLNGLCASCSRRAADRADTRRLFNNRPTINRRTRRPRKGPRPMTRNDRTPELCPMCRVALGFFVDPEGLCPRCAAVAREAGE